MKIKDIKDKKLQEKAVKYCIKHYLQFKQTKGEALQTPIVSAFNWNDTEEGHGFWETLNCGSATKEDRVEIVNKLIREISLRGRNFFRNDDGDIAYILLKKGRIYMHNEYNKTKMYLHTKYNKPPRKWSQGGTLWALTLDFKDFIQTGEKSNGNNGYGGLYCPHWGYSEDDMKAIREVAENLNYL